MFVNNVPSGIIEVLVKQEASAALEHEGNIRNISIIIFQFNSLIYMYIKQAVDKAMEAKSVKLVSGQIDGGKEYQAFTDQKRGIWGDFCLNPIMP